MSAAFKEEQVVVRRRRIISQTQLVEAKRAAILRGEGAEMRDNRFDPTTELFIAGIDPVNGKLDDSTHPCYDRESNETPSTGPVIQGLAKFMAKAGWFGAVVVTTIGNTRYVVAGRKRVRAARIANQWRAEAGLPLIKVPVDHWKATPGEGRDANLMSVQIAENALRTRELSPLHWVRAAARMVNVKASIEEIALAAGVTQNGVRRWLKLSELSPMVQAAIEARRITEEAALLLHGKPVEMQDELLEKLLEQKAADVQREVAARQPAEERRAQLVAKKKGARAGKANGDGRKRREPAASKSRVSKTDAKLAFGQGAKRSTRTLLKLLELPTCALSERDRLVVRWTQGLVPDAEVGLFAESPQATSTQ